MRVRAKNIPGIEIVLEDEEAAELAHILHMYAIQAGTGTFGTGTSIDNSLAFANATADAVSKSREAVSAAR
jgi:hypothetical protein